MLKKVNILNIILYIVFFIIIGRLYYLQIIKYDYYQELLNSLNSKEVLGDTMPRGKIYDKNGVLLVDNTLVKTIYYKKVDGMTVKDEIELAYFIKDYLELDYSKLTNSYLKDFYILTNAEIVNERITSEEFDSYKKRKISDNEYYKLKKSRVLDEDLSKYTEEDKKAIYLYYLMNNGYSYDDKIIKLNATEAEFAFFSESNFKLSGFDTKYTYDRLYLYGDTLKSILGKTGNITSENKDYYLDKGYSLNDIVGLTNLEYMYDDYLKGEKEVYKIVNDEKILVSDGRIGNDLYLTIDINIQKLVDDTLKEEIELAYLVKDYLDLDYSKLTNSYLKDFYILTHEDEINKRISKKDYNDYQNRLITSNEFYKLKKETVNNQDLDKYNDTDKKAIYLYYLMNNGYSHEDKIIKKDCLIEEFLFFSESNSNLSGFDTKYTYEREYLYGDTLKSVLGHVGSIPSENQDYYLNKGYSLSNQVGLSNLEFIYDDYLRGTDEVYQIKNGEKRLIKEGVIGKDLVLTININLQKYVDSVLSEEIKLAKKNYSTKYFNHSYVVISDTYGSILAMSGKEYFNGKVIVQWKNFYFSQKIIII